MEIVNNGAPAAAMVTTSWVRDDFASGRRRFKVYAMHVPLAQSDAGISAASKAGPKLVPLAAPTVIGELALEVPNLEIARMLHTVIGEMLQKQPPEIQVASHQ